MSDLAVPPAADPAQPARPAGWTVRPIGPTTAARLRADATDVRTVATTPGSPCRQCLRDAAVGDQVVLVSYDPFAGWDDPSAATSPYRSPSPVFLHRDDCADRVDTAPLPRQLTDRVVSLRAFDAGATMLDAAVLDGGSLPDAIVRMLADPAVDRLHVHNAAPGCFAAVVTRR